MILRPLPTDHPQEPLMLLVLLLESLSFERNILIWLNSILPVSESIVKLSEHESNVD
jgi:hypothetical protein